MTPIGAAPLRTAEVVSPDTCTHLTGHDHVTSLTAALADVTAQVDTLDRWGRLIAEALCGPERARLLAAGNGGSAAEAQHLTAELVGRYRSERRAFSAICLHGDSSAFTAACNDYGVEEAFARIVEGHARPGDVLLLLSTSGSSPNVVAAAKAGLEIGLTVWALTGPAPNPLAAMADAAIAVDAPTTATVQELHLSIVHALCLALDCALGVSP